MLNKTNDGFSLRLKTSLYNDAIIDQAIKDFRELAAITKEDAGNYIAVTIHDDKETSLEFCNYLLGLVRSGKP